MAIAGEFAKVLMRALLPWRILRSRRICRCLAAVLMTAALFVAYEAAYWANHWLSHRVGWLWEFHKVHHSAESLSLLTNFRVHPVDSIIFYNMAAAMTGATAGLVCYLFGGAIDPVSVSGTNLLVFLSSFILSYLQHSHLWISTSGRWGRLILSPAHHQLHHSVDPRHHNRNLGATLAVFDRAFGTLLIPARRRERLTFGVRGLGYDPHGAKGAVVMPFVDAARRCSELCHSFVLSLSKHVPQTLRLKHALRQAQGERDQRV